MQNLEKYLIKCEKCGEYKGAIKAKDLNWDYFCNKEEMEKSEEYITVTCLCNGVLYPKCKKNKIHRPISNSYEVENNNIEHWPWFSGIMLCQECKRLKRIIKSIKLWKT